MSLWSRLANVFRPIDRDIDEELQSHFDEAQSMGRDPSHTARAFGSRLQTRERVRDVIVSQWLDTLAADAIFGWRQLLKHKASSAAAILSLALGIGASLAAFRLIDALFLRPLPVAHPERLHVLTWQRFFDGETTTSDQFDYPSFRAMRAALPDPAALIAIGFASHIDLTFGSDQEMERAWRQYVSGWTFKQFGLNPALGRLFQETDDSTPGSAPYAVISYDYWSRRFGEDPSVIGHRFRAGNDLLEIIGVAPEGFTGTDPGVFIDIFICNMMNLPAINNDWNGYRIWFVPNATANLNGVREELHAALHSFRLEQVRSWAPGRSGRERDSFVAAEVHLEAASQGRSSAQTYLRTLMMFAVLIGLVLLIACGNVANLMTARAATRAREMALRVSIGAGRARLVQLLLVESSLIAVAAVLLGLVFSDWAAPFVLLKLYPPDRQMRLDLNTDWRVAIFTLALTCAITLALGILPALRASSLEPVIALKGGGDPRSHRRIMNGLSAIQVDFCSFVILVAGLFVLTFQRMANQPTGFSAERVLILDSVSKTGRPARIWYDAARQLASLPGVESAALAQYALMSFNAIALPVWANGQAPDGTWANSTWFLGVSPGWFETMQLQRVDGRDFRWDDTYPSVAIVNEKFARRYFGPQNPIGQTFDTISPERKGARVSLRIIGVVGDARYEDMRLPVPATAYVPFQTSDAHRVIAGATFLVRTKAVTPLSLASALRREMQTLQPDFRITNVTPQEELIRVQMLREHLLAILALFFASVALILATVGLYGVLSHAVLERQRELGIRIALGASPADITRRVVLGIVAMIAIGLGAGLSLGFASEPYIAKLLYQVKATDPDLLTALFVAMLGAAALAALPPVLRAVRIDPAVLLRSD